MPQNWERSVFIPVPKKGNLKECSNYQTVALIFHASKVMLKILQARLQQYMYRELPDVQAGFRKGRGTRDQIANIHWLIEQGNSKKKSTTASLTALKLLTILTEMGIPRLLRNLYACQEATVRILCGTTDFCKIGKGMQQGCIYHPVLHHAECQAG